MAGTPINTYINAFVDSEIDKKIVSTCSHKQTDRAITGFKVYLSLFPPRKPVMALERYNMLYSAVDRKMSQAIYYAWIKKFKWKERACAFDRMMLTVALRKDIPSFLEGGDPVLEPSADEPSNNEPSATTVEPQPVDATSVFPITRHQLRFEAISDIGGEIVEGALIEYRDRLLPALRNMEIPDKPSIKDGAALVRMGLDLTTMAEKVHRLNLEIEGLASVIEGLELNER